MCCTVPELKDILVRKTYLTYSTGHFRKSKTATFEDLSLLLATRFRYPGAIRFPAAATAVTSATALDDPVTGISNYSYFALYFERHVMITLN